MLTRVWNLGTFIIDLMDCQPNSAIGIPAQLFELNKGAISLDYDIEEQGLRPALRRSIKND